MYHDTGTHDYMKNDYMKNDYMKNDIYMMNDIDLYTIDWSYPSK